MGVHTLDRMLFSLLLIKRVNKGSGEAYRVYSVGDASDPVPGVPG